MTPEETKDCLDLSLQRMSALKGKFTMFNIDSPEFRESLLELFASYEWIADYRLTHRDETK